MVKRGRSRPHGSTLNIPSETFNNDTLRSKQVHQLHSRADGATARELALNGVREEEEERLFLRSTYGGAQEIIENHRTKSPIQVTITITSPLPNRAYRCPPPTRERSLLSLHARSLHSSFRDTLPPSLLLHRHCFLLS